MYELWYIHKVVQPSPLSNSHPLKEISHHDQSPSSSLGPSPRQPQIYLLSLWVCSRHYILYYTPSLWKGSRSVRQRQKRKVSKTPAPGVPAERPHFNRTDMRLGRVGPGAFPFCLFSIHGETWWSFLFRVNVSHGLHTKDLKPKPNNAGSCLDFTPRKHMEKVEKVRIKSNHENFQN